MLQKSPKQKKKMKVCLVTIDIQKTFDSLDLNSLISTLVKYGFCKIFVLCINKKSGVLCD